MIFSFAERVPEIDFGVNVAVECDGNPDAARLTAPLKPLVGVIVIS